MGMAKGGTRFLKGNKIWEKVKNIPQGAKYLKELPDEEVKKFKKLSHSTEATGWSHKYQFSRDISMMGR